MKSAPQDVCYENELISLSDLGIATTQADELIAVSSSGGFLPRIQLYGGNSEPCKEGKIGIGRYGLVRDKDRIEDLTNEVTVLVINGRSKAMQIDGDQIVTNYDRKSEEFQRIAVTAEEADSGCMFGPEFLIWIPTANTFATFFLSSKTSRREAGTLSARLGKAAILKSKLIKTKKYSWHGPVFDPCDTPTFDLPPVADIRKQNDIFMSPKSSGAVKAQQPASGGRAR